MTVQAEPKRIRLHAGQAKVMRSDRRFVLASAGTQSGKTWVGPHWMLQEIRRAGPGDYLVASPSYQLMGKNPPIEEVSGPLNAKINKIISKVGETGLRHLGTTPSLLRDRIKQSLTTHRSYTLDPERINEPARANGQTQPAMQAQAQPS